jgi:uncharacterized protein with GYD domain
MPRYLWQGSYTLEGIRGLVEEGGSSRRDALERIVVDGLGGYVHDVYFAFGDQDVYVIADVPDHETAAAVSMTVAATGAVRVKTTLLLTPEEMDVAAKMSVRYRAPGSPDPDGSGATRPTRPTGE